MGFKCSILGHRFEEPGIVHEREQRGDEVITTKRKVRICTLCGKQRVLAESKEITKQMNNGADDTTGDSNTTPATTDDTDSARGENESSPAHATSESESTNAETETGAGTGFRAVDRVRDETDFSDDHGPKMADLQGSDDDGVILSEEDDRGREYGEWPDEAGGTGVDTSWDPETIETPSQSGNGGSSSVAGASSALSVDAANDAVIMDESDESAETSTEKRSISCRNCEFSVIASDSPFRSGDICPRCHESYLSDKG